MAHVTHIKLHYSLAALQAERAKLVRIQQKEYQTRGNTQRCQELWTQIENIDKEIAERFMGGESL
jgi:hypothetical protein